MAHASGPIYSIKNEKKYRKNNSLQNKKRHKATPADVIKSSFIVWLQSRYSRTEGFVAWTQSAVAELSPNICDAWRFPTSKAANDAIASALGLEIESYNLAVFPEVL